MNDDICRPKINFLCQKSKIGNPLETLYLHGTGNALAVTENLVQVVGAKDFLSVV